MKTEYIALIDKLKSIKREGVLDDKTYKFMYPTSEEVPKLYGLPKIHKPSVPLRPIVSSIGSVTYTTSKHLAVILNSVKGKNGYAVKNSEDFVEQVSNKIIPPGYIYLLMLNPFLLAYLWTMLYELSKRS